MAYICSSRSKISDYRIDIGAVIEIHEISSPDIFLTFAPSMNVCAALASPEGIICTVHRFSSATN